jgi:hypothetical protein
VSLPDRSSSITAHYQDERSNYGHAGRGQTAKNNPGLQRTNL